MRYRRFGRTNLQLPVFSCGGMRFQYKWEDVPLAEIPTDNQANLEASIHRALELGIHHIETARGYGSSEAQLGRILPTLPREKIIVQTKVSPNADPQVFRETFERSLRQLRLPSVDLFSLHGINNEEILDWTLRPGGCLAMARQWQREGRVRFIGFSTHAIPRVITQAIESGEFDYVNLHWYFVNPLTWPCIQAATQRDMGVFIISPNDKGGRLQDRPEKMAQLCAPLTPMQFNDLFCLARPEVHTLSCGAARPSDFDEHVAALEYYDRAAEIVAPIVARLQAELVTTHGSDCCRHWHVGIPEFNQVPSQVNIIEILRLWIYGQALGLIPWAKMRYNLLGGNGGHWFPGEKADKLDAAKTRPILAGHPCAEQIVEALKAAHTLLHAEPQKRQSSA